MACALPKNFPAIVNRPHTRMFLVDNHWRVVAKDIYCAKKTMGRYFDLPYEWWNKLKVEPIARFALNGSEILQDF